MELDSEPNVSMRETGKRCRGEEAEGVLKPDDDGAEYGSPRLQEPDPGTLLLNTSMDSVPPSSWFFGR